MLDRRFKVAWIVSRMRSEVSIAYLRLLTVPLAGLMVSLPANPADRSGYLLDGSGNLVYSGSGACVRTGSWLPDRHGPGCDALPTPADGHTGTIIVHRRSGEAFSSAKENASPAGKQGTGMYPQGIE